MPPQRALIVLVEDDALFRELVARILEEEGYSVAAFESGEELLRQGAGLLPDLFLLDLDLPGMSGAQLCSCIRHRAGWETRPILLISGCSSLEQRVEGLEQGADDYVSKPVEMTELLARVRAQLRRAGWGQGRPAQEVLDHRDLRVDLAQRRVEIQGQAISLARKEFDILALLLEQRGRVVSRGDLLRQIWHLQHVPESRTLDVHIRGLREKIGDDSREPPLIETVRGTGYRIR